jgi:DNA-binding NtrC family response regulator
MSTRKRLVGVVDDDFDISQLFRDALRQINGISVFSFTDPVKAIEHLKINKKDYAVMISDLRMPVINGVQLLKTVKDLNPLARTILMTAYEINDNLFPEFTKHEIINGFLEKPIRLNDLYAEVTDQMHSYEVRKNRPLIQ